jgi:methionyl-tRNA formyltransferase
LLRLIEAGLEIEAIITKPDTAKGRGHKLIAPEVKTIGEQHGIKVLQPTRLGDVAEYLGSLSTPIGVLVSYGKIIPASILDLFPGGIVNLHPSLLPKYRGPSPIESAILNGDSETGVTLMKLSPEMDTGPIYAQETLALTGTESKMELYDRLERIGSDMLIRHLPGIADGSLQPTPQDDSSATYCQMLSKADALLNPKTDSSGVLARKVRAYAGFPKAKLELLGQVVIISAAHAADSPTTELDPKCADGAYLAIDRLVPPGGREMTAQDFLNGHRK